MKKTELGAVAPGLTCLNDPPPAATTRPPDAPPRRRRACAARPRTLVLPPCRPRSSRRRHPAPARLDTVICGICDRAGLPAGAASRFPCRLGELTWSLTQSAPRPAEQQRHRASDGSRPGSVVGVHRLPAPSRTTSASGRSASARAAIGCAARRRRRRRWRPCTSAVERPHVGAGPSRSSPCSCWPRPSARPRSWPASTRTAVDSQRRQRRARGDRAAPRSSPERPAT